MEYDVIFETEEGREGWQVTDAGAANWALEKIRNAELNIEKAKKKRDELIQAAEQIFLEETAEAQNNISFFTKKLRPYAEQNLINGKRFSKLPAGILKFTRQPNKFVFDDGEVADAKSKKLLEWCADHCPTAVKEKISRSVDWLNFKKNLIEADDNTVCTADGEVIGGLKCIPQEDKFSVVTNDN